MSDDHIDDVEEGMAGRRISRRRMLQNIGVASAVAWTAPIVTSIGSKAFAAGSSTCQGNDWSCGQELIICGNGGDLGLCVCDLNENGSPVCWADYLCGSQYAKACTSNADCANTPYPVCLQTCCGQTCAPLCYNTGPHHAPQGGARASGL